MKQVGFNHNIQYRGIMFHVQTEDYGVELRKIVTQLFYSGQIICKSETSYEKLPQNSTADEMVEEVKAMMRLQHKKMLKDLANGAIEIPENILCKQPKQTTS